MFDLLNTYKSNIVEISICCFINEIKMNFEIINKIINILEYIFIKKSENISNNMENNINKIIIKGQKHDNNNHNIKTLTFENNEISSYIDITTKLFDKINNIINLTKIEGIFIDSNIFGEYQFSDIMKYISKKLGSLKYLKIKDFGLSNSHYADFIILCSYINDQIEVIDFSNSFCLSSILSVLNMKKHPLKELRLKLYSYKDNQEWNFLIKSKNTLEIFYLEIKESKIDNSSDFLCIFNEMNQLKQLELLFQIKINDLINFKNYNNLEYFSIYLYLKDINNEPYKNEMYYHYFEQFKKLKYLSIKLNEETPFNEKVQLPKLKLPQKLTSFTSINIEGTYLVSLLKNNEYILVDLEELKIENPCFKDEDLESLTNLFKSFKNIKKLALNKFIYHKKINIETFKYKYYYYPFYMHIPIIFKNIPSLIELDISENEHKEKLFKSELFENIRLAIPKKLLSLKIFHSNISISLETFNYLPLYIL